MLSSNKSFVKNNHYYDDHELQLDKLQEIIEYHHKYYTHDIPIEVIDSIRDTIIKLTWRSNLFISHNDTDYTESAIVMDFYSNTGFGTLEYAFKFNGTIEQRIIDEDLELDIIGPVTVDDITDNAIINFMRAGNPHAKRTKTAMIIVQEEPNSERYRAAYGNGKLIMENRYKCKVELCDDFLKRYSENPFTTLKNMVEYMVSCDMLYFGKRDVLKSNPLYSTLYNIVENYSHRYNMNVIYEVYE